MSSGEPGAGVGRRGGDSSVVDGNRFLHTVLENAVHFCTSSSPALHLTEKHRDRLHINTCKDHWWIGNI